MKDERREESRKRRICIHHTSYIIHHTSYINKAYIHVEEKRKNSQEKGEKVSTK
jgi:hypothetical protein